MTAFLHWLAWEWLNIALEYSATAWVRLPRWFLSVAAVNLATHPLLMLLVARSGNEPRILYPAEAAIVLVEAALLFLVYRRRARIAALAGIALFMNAASFATGLALGL